MNRKILIALAGVAIAVPALAVAGGFHHGSAMHMEERFSALDSDGDGRITEAEMQAKRSRYFADADANADGVLDRQELEALIEARRKARMDRRFARLDANGDGGISAEEFAARKPGWIGRADADGDGGVTLDELKAFRPHHKRSE